MTTCPVCGAEIGEANPKPDQGYGSESYPGAQTEYRDETYQLCGTGYKELFESTPEEYA